MACGDCDVSEQRKPKSVSAKFVVAGGARVGKTTFVGSISEIDPLRTRVAMSPSSTSRSSGVDGKASATAAMDFGRITIDNDLILYLFGTPNQERFGFMWNDIVTGALGGVVVVDSHRLQDSFYAIDYFESMDIPFVVALNSFDGDQPHPVPDVRAALQLPAEVLLLPCDARDRQSVKAVLLSLFDIILERMVAAKALSGTGSA